MQLSTVINNKLFQESKYRIYGKQKQMIFKKTTPWKHSTNTIKSVSKKNLGQFLYQMDNDTSLEKSRLI